MVLFFVNGIPKYTYVNVTHTDNVIAQISLEKYVVPDNPFSVGTMALVRRSVPDDNSCLFYA